MGPRLRGGVLHGPGRQSGLAEALQRTGHAMTSVTAFHAGAPFDLVILDAQDPEWVRAQAEELAPRARQRQMFLHTCLIEGVQAFDPVELRGAVTMAAHEIQPGYWVTSAADDVGEAVVSLLVAQAGGVNVPITDAQRPRLAAAARLGRLGDVAKRDALELIREELPGIAATVEEPEAIAPARQEQLRAALGGHPAGDLYEQLERRVTERNSTDV
ncbi:hypothetical protein [Corynebacterium timonense]|uniref:Rossmann-like domain-containing protein n=1 Tax=Corynebacterium timonense TaxID=441500 RepID=A0A1H1L4R9_9CORY|nr:hypothetical protein [Corynebacterium timonense]SDR69571.1 hypothetical protein SAMN04488539_0064 [Corynebacterium timonense]